MTDVVLRHTFLVNSRGFTMADTTSVTWAFDASTNKLTATSTSSAPADGSITNAKLADMVAATIKGRASGAGTGVPVDLTAAQVKTILALASTDLSDFTEAAQDAALGVIVDSTTVDFTYNDAGNSLTAVVKSPLLLSDGSANTPTYSFSADPGTGMFRVGTSILGFAVGTLEGARIANGGNLQVTGTFATGYKLAQGVEIGISSAVGFVQSFDRNLSVYKPLRFEGSSTIFGVSGSEIITIDTVPTTGAQTATFAATNKPGTATGAPTKWLPVKLATVQYYIPMFAA